MTDLSAARRHFLKTASSLATIGVVGPALLGANAGAQPALDPFIEALIARMTPEEKAGQLSLYGDVTRPGDPDVNPTALALETDTMLKKVAAGEISCVFNGIGVQGGRVLQSVAMEKSRLKIPLIFAADVIHGLRTVFPIPLGEAASFDPALAERTARATAVEASAVGLHWTFAPMVDMARDQRWGRVAEGAGEDTYLGCRFAEARVRGFQGKDLRAKDAILATPKHFAAYGAVTGGMEYNAVDIPETTLRDVHLPPFKAAFDAGALTTMSAFNDVSGVPATANKHLLTDILRKEWGFRGLVVSDYASDDELVTHGYAADSKDAAHLAIMAGCDMSMASGIYSKYLPELMREGSVPVAVVDEAVRRVLRVKKAIGLFDDPYRSLDVQRERSMLSLPATLALAREAGRRSVVLLKNEGGLLPLQKAGQSIALIGPFGADVDNLMGPWAIFPDKGKVVSLEQGLRRAMQDPARLTVVKGCAVEQPIDGGIAQAVAAARLADVVILAIGEGEAMSGESQARVDIVIPPPQQALAEAVAATGKPVVVLLRHGRALALKGAVRDADAIMCTWFLGSETGHAIADLVFGDHSPSGRLPVSFPQESGQQPFFYNHRNTGRAQTSPNDGMFKSRYREVGNEALYPFGHGLVYGQVRYGVTRVDSERMAGASLTVRATVSNAGSRAVRETVQLYIRDRVASLVRPVRELKNVRLVELAAGQSQEVTFELSRGDLSFVNAKLKRVSEPGRFDVWIAPSSTTGTAAQFTLV